MGGVMQIAYLLFVATVVTCSGEEHIRKETRKSKLILEYNWPEPHKNLRRLPHPKSCHHFYHMKADGSPVMKRCHGDKIFDYRTLLCKKESLAKCWKNIVYKKNARNMKKVKHYFSCPFPWGLYPNTEDCSLFYECLGGKVFISKCPHSMLFDKVERTCVHSSKAMCAEYSDISTTEGNRQSSFEMRTDFNDNSSTKEGSIITTIDIKATKTPEIHENTSEKGDSSEEQKSMTIENTYHSIKYETKLSTVLTTAIKPEQIKILVTNSDEDDNRLEEKDMQSSTNSKSKLTTRISTDNRPHEKVVTEIKPANSVTLTEKGSKTQTSSIDEISDLLLTTSADKLSGDTNVRIKPLTVNVTFKNDPEVANVTSFEKDNSSFGKYTQPNTNAKSKPRTPRISTTDRPTEKIFTGI